MRTARAGTMLNYYVYYRVVIAETARVRAVLEAVQAALGEDTGVRGRLLRCSDDPSTWMEIYEGVADPPRFKAALERLLGALYRRVAHRSPLALSAAEQKSGAARCLIDLLLKGNFQRRLQTSMTNWSDRRPDTPMNAAAAQRCRLK